MKTIIDDQPDIINVPLYKGTEKTESTPQKIEPEKNNNKALIWALIALVVTIVIFYLINLQKKNENIG